MFSAQMVRQNSFYFFEGKITKIERDDRNLFRPEDSHTISFKALLSELSIWCRVSMVSDRQWETNSEAQNEETDIR
jgi:hypothetical protein